MKVIFLDCDGVLTYSTYSNSETANIDMEKVKLLKEICDKTNAKVVISSSWRGTADYTPKIYWTLIDILKRIGIEVLGDIPRISYEELDDTSRVSSCLTLDEIADMKIKYGEGRAAEIQKWLSEHEVDNFVILDDDDWDWSSYGLEAHWVRSTWFGDGGLKRKHVKEAVEILTDIIRVSI